MLEEPMEVRNSLLQTNKYTDMKGNINIPMVEISGEIGQKYISIHLVFSPLVYQQTGP